MNDSPSDADLQPLIQKYFQSGFEIRPILETLFTSEQFYAPANRYACVKNPPEFAAGVLKTLQAPIPRDVARFTRNMGQDLLDPPTVKGWDGGDAWINTNTLSARVDFTSRMIGVMNRRSDFRSQILDVFMNGDGAAAPEKAVQMLWNTMLPGRALNSSVQKVLVDYVQGGADAKSPKVLSAKLPGLVNLVLGSPDYQMA